MQEYNKQTQIDHIHTRSTTHMMSTVEKEQDERVTKY